MKTFKEILLDVIPKDCYWEEMDNLTNCPTRYVIEAAELYAQQHKEEIEKLKDLLCESQGVQDKTALILKTQTIARLKDENSRLLEEKAKLIDGITLKVKHVDHQYILLTNRRGDTCKIVDEDIIDFIHRSSPQ